MVSLNRSCFSRVIPDIITPVSAALMFKVLHRTSRPCMHTELLGENCISEVGSHIRCKIPQLVLYIFPQFI